MNALEAVAHLASFVAFPQLWAVVARNMRDVAILVDGLAAHIFTSL